jgi:DNA-binding MltR family transcriptional regulator
VGKSRKLELLKTEDVESFMAEFGKESDRAAVVLGGAFLDAQLERTLRAFIVDDSKAADAAFDPFGGFAGSFGARIRMAYLLGLLAPTEYDDLCTIQKLRNDFAHRLQGISFSDESVAARCQNLRTVKDIWVEPHHPQDARTLFVVAVSLLSMLLRSRAARLPSERRSVLDPVRWQLQEVRVPEDE